MVEQPFRFSHADRDFIHASRMQRDREEQQEKVYQEIQTRHTSLQAKHLATKALFMQEQAPRLFRESLLLAVEALRRHQCVEADQAVRQGLTFLPRFHARLRMATTGQTILFSGNGQNLATAGTHGVSWIANLGSSDESTKTVFLEKTHAIALSYDGEYLLVGCSTGETWLLHTGTGNRIAVIKHDAPLRCLTLTRKQPYVAALGYDDGRIALYQFIRSDISGTSSSERHLIQHTQRLQTFQHTQAIVSLAFSHDDQYLVSGGMDRMVCVWRKEGGAALSTYDFQSPICSTLFSPDDTFIAIQSEDGRAFVWQWEPQSRKMWKRKHHSPRRIPQAGSILATAFGGGGNCLITASADGFPRIWKLGDMIEEVKLLSHKGSVSSLCYHQGMDWLALACTDGTVMIYSLPDGLLKYVIPHDTPVVSIAFNGQKPYLATVDRHGCVWMWQLQDGNLPRRFSHQGKIAHLLFGQNENEHVLYLTVDLLSGGSTYTISLDASLMNRTYEDELLPDGEARQSASPQKKNTMRVLSGNGRYIADVTSDGYIHVMRIGSNNDANILQVIGNIEILVFNFSGDSIAFANDNQILLWQWREKNNEQPLVLFPVEGARNLAFSQDDTYLVVTDRKNNVLIWQWQVQMKEPYLVLRHEDPVSAISLSPDNRYLITLNNSTRARVWYLTMGGVTRYLLHKEDVVSATFDNESNYIATASADHTVGIWNVSTGEQCARLPHTERVYAVAFSNDGRYLATACGDAIVRIWQWKQKDLEKEAKLRLTGNLTYEEWQEYMGDEPYQETFDDLGWRELSPRDSSDEEER